MGVKSTRFLTRPAAEAKYLELHVEAQRLQRLERLDARAPSDPLKGIDWRLRDRIGDLSDDDAIAIWKHVDLARRAESMLSNARDGLSSLGDDGRLERELERINDMVHDGEGFENYVINETGRDDDAV